jgi:23S rRNA (guanosine2251-2'-O)-methyltransferase
MESSEHAVPKKQSLIIGRQPVVEALEAGRAIDKILLQANVSGDIIGKIRVMARERNIPVQTVPPEKLQALTRSHHQGCIAQAALIVYADLQDIIKNALASATAPLFVMLDGITDVRNIGGISRTAVCCGAQAIIIPDKGVGALNEDALKASAGALEKISICRVGSLLKAIDDLHANGIKVVVSAMQEETMLQTVDFAMPICIVLGSEGKGVQSYIARAADVRFSIPMSGAFDSFNVSVAAGIILYEAMMQRIRSA